MKGMKPYVVVFVIQTIYAAMFLLSKAAFDHGINNFIFVFYRQAIATLFLIPFAFIFEWKLAPPLSFRTLCKIFLLSFWITLSLDLNVVGLIYTSPTLASACSNCIPVITFFIALLLRIESLKIKTGAGIAKLIGIVACLGGAATLAFYKGPQLKLLSHHHLLGYLKQHDQTHSQSDTTWIKGCFFLLLSATFWGLWLVLQAFVIKDYPSKLIFTTLQCFLSSIQSLVVAFAIERDIEKWKLGWNVTLLAIAYCGIIATGVAFYLMSWVIEKKGPVFLSISTPLVLIITIFSSIILLGDIIYLGSILGGFMLVVGLYSVLWGKNREQTQKASHATLLE